MRSARRPSVGEMRSQLQKMQTMGHYVPQEPRVDLRKAQEAERKKIEKGGLPKDFNIDRPFERQGIGASHPMLSLGKAGGGSPYPPAPGHHMSVLQHAHAGEAAVGVASMLYAHQHNHPHHQSHGKGAHRPSVAPSQH